MAAVCFPEAVLYTSTFFPPQSEMYSSFCPAKAGRYMRLVKGIALQNFLGSQVDDKVNCSLWLPHTGGLSVHPGQILRVKSLPASGVPA